MCALCGALLTQVADAAAHPLEQRDLAPWGELATFATATSTGGPSFAAIEAITWNGDEQAVIVDYNIGRRLKPIQYVSPMKDSDEDK